MKRIILVLLILLPFVTLAQPYNINWDGATSVLPWVQVSNNTFNVTPERFCQGTHSIRTRVQGNQNLGTSVLRSPLLFTATGGVITFSFDYKWLVYNPNIGTQPPFAGSANQLDLKWEWANSTSGPWNTFQTIDNTNHVVSINCTTITTTFAPKPGSLYVRLTVSNKTATADNYLYIDNINVDQGPTPTCLTVNDIFITNKTTTGFTINWENATQTVASTDWEVRTSGAPGSGPVGLVVTNPQASTVTGNPVTVGNSISVTGLTASTKYKVYIKSNCSATDSSFWTGIEVYTPCAPPPFNMPTTYNVCGLQELVMNAGGGSTFWYKEGELLTPTPVSTFTIPEVSASETYKVYNGIYDNSIGVVQVGTGITSAVDVTPFAETKSQKIQYIYLAEELKLLGYDRGLIKSFGFKTGPNAGTTQRKNFRIHMGETNLEEYSIDNKFVPTSRLTLVKNAGDQTLVSNDINMFELDNVFMWDGNSNIVVQISYSNVADNAPSATTNIFSSFSSTSSNRTLFTKSNTALDLSAIENVATGTRSVFRTNGYFDIIEGCFNEPKTVEVVYTPAPTLNLSADIINNCAGNPLTKLYVLTGVGSYNSYVWTVTDPNDPAANDNTHPNHPDNAIVGDQNVGWTFTTTMPMGYTLTAKNTVSGCIIRKQITVENNPAPQMLQLLNDYSLCFNDVQELKVDNFVNETTLKNGFNGALNATLVNAVSGDALVNETTLKTEGSGSLKVEYAAQTNALVNLATTVNTTNLKSIVVEFDQIAALQATSTAVYDYGYVEYTTDNGATWKPFLPAHYTGQASTTLTKPTTNTSLQAMFFTQTSYADWAAYTQASIPANTEWKSEKFVVPASDLTGNGIFKLRFRVGADGNSQYEGWYIDNVKITPVSNYKVTWTPIANLYYDQAATMPYDAAVNSGTLYLKGSVNSLNVPYKVEIENQYGCKIEKNFTVSIGLKEAPVVNDITSCGPISVANTNFGKNVNGVLTYYSSSTASVPITQITTSGVYYVEQEIYKCKSARIPFTVAISPVATVPVAPATQSFCGAATVSNLMYNPISGFQINWYTTPTGGTPLAAAIPINNGMYYGEFTNGTCTSSSRVAVTVSVGVVPTAVSLSNVYICGTSTISSISVPATPGATVNWYQNITDVTPLSYSTTLSTGTYYIAQKIGNCESPRTAVSVSTVQNLGLPTANTTQTFCGSATVADLMATTTAAGASVYWYAYSTSDTPIASTTPLVTGTYYVGQSIGDCDSAKRPISVKILSVSAPIINPITICGDATVSTIPLNASAGSSYKVYNSAFATTEMGQNDVVTTGIYYISKVENGCETARAQVYITVTPRPNAPTGNVNQSFVDYAEVKDLKTNEANVVWYDSYNDAINNVNPLPSYQPLQHAKTYYGVIIAPGNCPSLPLAVKVNIVLGMNDLDIAALKYYPNPVHSELNISYKEAIKSVEIFDILGKQVKAEKFDNNDVRIDVSHLSVGTYMVKVHTSTGSQFLKIIKK